MKRIVFLVFVLAAPAVFVHAAALGTSSRTVIPSEVQQIISVDYRALRNSPTRSPKLTLHLDLWRGSTFTTYRFDVAHSIYLKNHS